VAGPLLKSVTRVKGAPVIQRTHGLGMVTSLIGKTTKEQVFGQKDPLRIVRKKLDTERERLRKTEEKISDQIQSAVVRALKSQETDKEERTRK
jgi:hypothetical protein